jgi:hypothetical protein
VPQTGGEIGTWRSAASRIESREFEVPRLEARKTAEPASRKAGIKGQVRRRTREQAQDRSLGSPMTTLLIAEHDHETLKGFTNKALTAASLAMCMQVSDPIRNSTDRPSVIEFRLPYRAPAPISIERGRHVRHCSNCCLWLQACRVGYPSQ